MDAPRKLGSISHIRLTVTDVPRAQAFYTPLLTFIGFELVERSTTRLAFARVAGHGNLHWFILSRADPANAARPHDRFAPGFHHLAWNADSREQVDAFHEMLVEHGATVLDPPAEYAYEPGYYAVFFSDPDGMKLELVHVPRASSEAYWNAFVARGGPLET